jgi:hypothetical protein
VGPGWGTVFINLTDIENGFSNRWFQAYPGQLSNKDLLSIGLVAMSEGSLVHVNVNLDLLLEKNNKKFKNVHTGYSGINAIYLIK